MGIVETNNINLWSIDICKTKSFFIDFPKQQTCILKGCYTVQNLQFATCIFMHNRLMSYETF